MAKTIDPAFQAAPFLGESSHDPIEFSRRQKTIKNQAQIKKDKENEQNTAEGLQKLMLDIKGWEDEKGFQEVMSSYNKNIDAFMQLSKEGLNLTSPKTESELIAFKKLGEEHKKTVQLLDTWERNKKGVDLFNAELKQNPDKYDLTKSRANLEKQLKENAIEGRNLNLENLLVRKPDLGNVWKWYKSIEDQIPKLDLVGSSYVDENGITHTTTTQKQDSKKQEEQYKAIRRLFQYAPDDVKEAVKYQGELAKGKEPFGFTDEDRVIAMIAPEYQEKFIDKPSGKGGGLSISFLGQKTNMDPGRQRKEPLNYGDKTFTSTYEFQSTKPLKIPLGAAGSEIFMGKTWQPLTGGGDVEGTLSYYDSNTDKFIFRTTQAGAAPFVMNNMTIAVPREVIGEQADELPIEVNGEVKKLKDVYGTKQVTKKKIEIPGGWSQGVYTGSKNKTK